MLVVASCGGSNETNADQSGQVVTERVSAVDDPAARSEGAAPGSNQPPPTAQPGAPAREPVRTGAQVLVDDGLSRLVGQRVGLIANRASAIDSRSVIDILHQHEQVELVAIFTPEHGIRADAAAGERVDDGLDPVTGVTVHSLYGANRAPTEASLADLDVLVFDLQDAGARFYTYTSTMGLAMQAAAEADLPFMVLDRPNPLGGSQPDGPVAGGEPSFLAPYPTPAIHGLTAGELALAIVGEQWVDGLDGLDLDVVPLQGWRRSDRWTETGLDWVPPSPGLVSAEVALLYPATVLLESTTLSYGRGTDRPFGQFGAPWLDADQLVAQLESLQLAGVRFEPVTFTPAADSPSEGADVRFAGEAVSGVRLEVTNPDELRPLAVGVHIIDQLLAQNPDRTILERPDHFDLLAGTSELRDGLEAGEGARSLIRGWSPGLEIWTATVAPYLLY